MEIMVTIIWGKIFSSKQIQKCPNQSQHLTMVRPTKAQLSLTKINTITLFLCGWWWRWWWGGGGGGDDGAVGVGVAVLFLIQ